MIGSCHCLSLPLTRSACSGVVSLFTAPVANCFPLCVFLSLARLAELPTFKSNVKAICEPLESLNEHVVDHYDWNEPGSSERAVRMETATAAIEALVQTQQAAVKVRLPTDDDDDDDKKKKKLTTSDDRHRAQEFQEYLEKKNDDLGKLRAQIAERDKALSSYDQRKYDVDELRKKPPKDSSKMTKAEEVLAQAKLEYDNLHRIINGELLELRASKFAHFDRRYDEFVAAQLAFFSGVRNAWQLVFLEDYADTVAVPTPTEILEKRRQFRDKSDKKAGKEGAKALENKLRDEKKVWPTVCWSIRRCIIVADHRSFVFLFFCCSA